MQQNKYYEHVYVYFLLLGDGECVLLKATPGSTRQLCDIQYQVKGMPVLIRF